MNNNQNDEEVYILVDEDGNEIQEETEKVEMEEEYRLEDDSDSYEDDDEEYDDNGDGGFVGNVSNKLLAIFGAVIAVAAICVGIFFITSRTGGSGVDFSTVGSNVAEIGVIGGTNIRAIAAAKGAYIDDINEAIKSYDYTEADLEGGITTVDITLTSIVKDLKIKFVNASGKLIASVPFEVEVTDPSGKTTTWTDTDKDGIIYQSDIAGGSYTVKLIPMSGYDALYDFSNSKSAKSVSVKTQLDYQKVDVKNEIKIQNSSNQTEDAALKETVVESKLKDTVAYVMSNKTATSGYTVIDKSTVANPIEALTKSYEAAIGRFKRLSGPVNVDESGDVSPDDIPHSHSYEGATWTDNGDGTCSATCIGEDCSEKDTKAHDYVGGKCSRCGSPENTTPVCEHTKEEYVYIIGTKMHKVVCADCKEVISEGETCEYPDVWTKDEASENKHFKACNKCGEKQYEYCVDSNGDEKCDACERAMAKPLEPIELDVVVTPASGTLNMSNNKTLKLSGKAETKKGSEGVSSYSYKWSLESGDAVSLPAVTENVQEITVEAKKTGEAVVKCAITANMKDGTSKTFTKTCKITVGAITVALDRTAKKVVYVNGDTFAVKATTKGGKDNTVKWSCSDESIASITTSENANSSEGTNTVTIKGLKPGKVTLTATSTEDSSIKASIEIVVATHPKDDKSTKLTDKSGKQVYVYDSASKSYREAVYADYYTGVDLYTPCDVVYTYTGWWTIDGKSYYFDSNGKKVTGDQVILGAKYSFDSNGVLKSGTGTFGIDVSTFNGTIDWNKVAKSGVNFAIIRCGLRGSTAGALYEDSKFATNIKNATAAGVKVGLYFFTQAVTEAEAVEEASMALTMAEGYKISYPIFIDVESATNGRANGLSKADRTKIINAFCKTISNGGYKAGIYANKTWFTNNMDVSQLTSYTIWLAQYASAPTYTASRYDVWQYSSEGSLNGISGNVDLDLSYLGY